MHRIAVVTRYFPSSGEPVYGRSLYETLRIIGRSADVRVFYPNAAYPSFLKPRSRTYDSLDPTFSPPDVSVSYYDYFALPLISRPFNAAMAFRAILTDVRNFAPDLVIGCFLYPAGYTALKIGKSLGIPVVAMSIGSDINRIGDPISAWYTRTLLREVDFLVAVSDDLRKKAVAMGALPSKTRAILNGCNLSVFRPMDRCQAREKLQIDPANEAVVFVGRMDLTKGLRELVQAAAQLHSSRPALQVFIAGDGPDRAVVESKIHFHNASGYIHLYPGCTFDEVAVWMTAANVVTLPSYMEGCPNVVVEALACGRPVVATNVGGIPELLNDFCGVLAPPREPAKLAEALASALDRSWDAAAIAAQGSRSWSATAAELMEVIEALIAKSRETTRAR
jgi:teichuronic acid biosynthesis glycosyltransferase TuaC